VNLDASLLFTLRATSHDDDEVIVSIIYDVQFETGSEKKNPNFATLYYCYTCNSIIMKVAGSRPSSRRHCWKLSVVLLVLALIRIFRSTSTSQYSVLDTSQLYEGLIHNAPALQVVDNKEPSEITSEMISVVKDSSFDATRSNVTVLVSAVENTTNKNKPTTPIFFPKRRHVQKVVILPGPHKTGTTTVQYNLYSWILKQKFPGFDEWAWPVPSEDELKTLKLTLAPVPRNHKFFALLSTRLVGLKRWGNPEVPHSAVIDLYRNAMQRAWDQGKSLLIASEFFYIFSLDEPERLRQLNNATSGADLLQAFLDILPLPNATVEREIVTAVHHRTPRVDHLVSLWHQTSVYGAQTLTKGKTDFLKASSLSDFITNPYGLQESMSWLNSLGLVHVFAKQNIPVILMDTAGAQNKSIDLSTAVACYALGIPCRKHATGQLKFLNTAKRRRKSQMLNRRNDTGDRDLDEATLEGIDRLLIEYDCQFQDYMQKQKHIQLLYADNLFRDCPKESPSLRRRSFAETIQSIVDLVCQAKAGDCSLSSS
jgi:hypothetical protein